MKLTQLIMLCKYVYLRYVNWWIGKNSISKISYLHLDSLDLWRCLQKFPLYFCRWCVLPYNLEDTSTFRQYFVNQLTQFKIYERACRSSKSEEVPGGKVQNHFVTNDFLAPLSRNKLTKLRNSRGKELEEFVCYNVSEHLEILVEELS